MHALNADTGESRWTFETDKTIVSSPAISEDGTIYFGSWNGRVYALDMFGNVKWEFKTGGAVSASPLLLSSEDGSSHIYVGSGDGSMYKFDCRNGRVLWKHKISQPIYSSAAASLNSKTLYFGSNDNHLYAIDAKSGKKIWRVELAGKIESSPAVRSSDGTIIVADFAGTVSAISRDGKIEWTYDVSDKSSIVSSPCLDSEGTVYIGSKAKTVYAIRRDGSLKWAFPLNANVDSTPILDKSGNLVFGSSKGNVFVLNSKTGRANFSFNIGSAVFGSVLLSHRNVMYVASEKGRIVAVGKKYD